MKKLLKFTFLLLPWFIGGLIFKTDTIFYKSLNKPFFAPKPIIFAVVWPILYFLITISIYKIFKKYNYKNTEEYNKILLINYFSNQLFTFLFFTLKSPFLGIIDTIIILLSSLFLYYETKDLDKNLSKFLIPYILWNIYALILIITIFFMNL